MVSQRERGQPSLDPEEEETTSLQVEVELRRQKETHDLDRQLAWLRGRDPRPEDRDVEG